MLTLADSSSRMVRFHVGEPLDVLFIWGCVSQREPRVPRGVGKRILRIFLGMILVRTLEEGGFGAEGDVSLKS